MNDKTSDELLDEDSEYMEWAQTIQQQNQEAQNNEMQDKDDVES